MRSLYATHTGFTPIYTQIGAMYAISNQQREDIIKFLAALQDLPGKDTKTINLKRRVGILKKKLENKQPVLQNNLNS